MGEKMRTNDKQNAYSLSFEGEGLGRDEISAFAIQYTYAKAEDL